MQTTRKIAARVSGDKMVGQLAIVPSRLASFIGLIFDATSSSLTDRTDFDQL